MNNNRPAARDRHRYLNLFQFRFPISAVASVGHRASGVFLFLLTPVLLFLMEYSLADADAYGEVAGWMQSIPAKMLLIIVFWSGFHHLFMGIRFLFMDLGIGEQKVPARITAWLVMAAGVLAAALTGWIYL